MYVILIKLASEMKRITTVIEFLNKEFSLDESLYQFRLIKTDGRGEWIYKDNINVYLQEQNLYTVELDRTFDHWDGEIERGVKFENLTLTEVVALIKIELKQK